MTYPPGGPSYPSQQPQYSTPTQQFDRAPEPAAPAGPSKLPLYLGVAVAVLGFAIYLSAFAPVFAVAGSPTFYFVIAPLLAGLLGGVSLLPKQDDRSAVAAVLAVLGFLLLILVVLADGPAIEWGFYLFIVFSVLQAIAAVGKLLLDAGIIAAPVPKPKYEQPAYGYGGPPQQGYYGQPQQGGPPQQRPGGYAPPQYGGYQGSSGPSTGGFPAIGQQGAPHNGPQNGPPTPPTGFPAFGHPQGSAPTAATGQQGGSHDAQQPQQQAPQQSAPPPS